VETGSSDLGGQKSKNQRKGKVTEEGDWGGGGEERSEREEGGVQGIRGRRKPPELPLGTKMKRIPKQNKVNKKRVQDRDK